MPRFEDYSAGVTLNTTVYDTIRIAETGTGNRHTTVLKLTNTPISLTDDASYMWGSVLLATFPKGRILVEGVVVKDVYYDVLASTMAAADGGDFSLGSTAEEDGTQDRATDINLCPSTSLDPIGTAVDSALAASAQIDGTATATPIYFNSQIDTADGSDLTEILGINGTITITWTNLGND